MTKTARSGIIKMFPRGAERMREMFRTFMKCKNPEGDWITAEVFYQKEKEETPRGYYMDVIPIKHYEVVEEAKYRVLLKEVTRASEKAEIEANERAKDIADHYASKAAEKAGIEMKYGWIICDPKAQYRCYTPSQNERVAAIKGGKEGEEWIAKKKKFNYVKETIFDEY